MGLCASNDEAFSGLRQNSKGIDAASRKRRNQNSNASKVLLLGTGESGKSTVFKQMKLLYGKGLRKKELARGARQNVTEALYKLIKQSKYFTEEEKIDACVIQDQASKDLYMERYLAHGLDMKFDDDVLNACEGIWNDPGIQNTFERRAHFQLQDNISFFMTRLRDLVDRNWDLDEEEMMRVRIRTTGLVRERFDVEGDTIEMLDVGGQRNERKKWIHQFQDVAAVIFVTAMSEYDQVLFEDESKNRMMESMTLFEQLTRSHWFERSTFVLFLNKKDLFELKFPKSSLKVCFDDWNDGGEVQDGIDFIANKYMALVEDGKDVLIHVTTATDKNNMAKVLTGVQVSILKEQLRKSGVMV